MKQQQNFNLEYSSINQMNFLNNFEFNLGVFSYIFNLIRNVLKVTSVQNIIKL